METTIRCRVCRYPIAERRPRGLVLMRTTWAAIGGGVVTVRCGNRHPFQRGACRTETVICIVDPLRVEAEAVA